MALLRLCRIGAYKAVADHAQEVSRGTPNIALATSTGDGNAGAQRHTDLVGSMPGTLPQTLAGG